MVFIGNFSCKFSFMKGSSTSLQNLYMQHLVLLYMSVDIAAGTCILVASGAHII